MIFRRQGFYKEMPHGEESDPSILDYVEKMDRNDIEKIYKYLNEGKVLVACGGIMTDIINPSNGFAGCPELKTDGIWVWSGDLAYYVKHYHLGLEEKFIETMKNNNWHIKDIPDFDYDNIEII